MSPAGYVDNLGYLRCAACALAADRTDRDVFEFAVYDLPHSEEDCDVCGLSLAMKSMADGDREK